MANLSPSANTKGIDPSRRRPGSPWEAYRPIAANSHPDKLVSPFFTNRTFRASQGPILPDAVKTPRENDLKHLTLPSEIFRPPQSSRLPVRRPGASSCKAALSSEGSNPGFREKSMQRFRSLPSNSQQSVYYTCCPSLSSDDEIVEARPHCSPDLWSLPLRSCLSDTNIPMDCDTASPPPTSRTVPPFFLNLSPRPLCAWRSATPAWQVLMRRMVGRSRRAAPSHVDEPPTAPSSSIDEAPLLDHDIQFMSSAHLDTKTRKERTGKESIKLGADLTELKDGGGGDKKTKLSSLGKIRHLYVYTAAALIQKYWRKFAARKLARHQDDKRVAKAAASKAATKIQAHWRGCTGRWKAYLVQQINLHQKCRDAAAVRLQRAWRRWRELCTVKLQRLVTVISHMRQLSSIAIQKAWRGYIVRKVLEEEWSRWVIKWVWDPAGRDVQVIGDFTEPPWLVRIPMKYCSIRRCYTTTVNRKAGRYELKFCVDGRYVCCGASTVVEDGAGHYNNVVDVFDVPKDSPFVRGRRVVESILAQNRNVSQGQSPRAAKAPPDEGEAPVLTVEAARPPPLREREPAWQGGSVKEHAQRRKRRNDEHSATPSSDTEASDLRSDTLSSSSSQLKIAADINLSLDVCQHDTSDPLLPARRTRRRRRRRRKSKESKLTG